MRAAALAGSCCPISAFDKSALLIGDVGTFPAQHEGYTRDTGEN